MAKASRREGFILNVEDDVHDVVVSLLLLLIYDTEN